MRGALRDPVVPTECPQEVADLITACRQRDQHLRPSAKDIVRHATHDRTRHRVYGWIRTVPSTRLTDSM